MTIFDKIALMKAEPKGHWEEPTEISYWGERIFAQIGVAIKLSEINKGKYDSIVEQAVDCLHKAFLEEGAVTNTAAKQAENILLPLAEEAKQYKMYHIAHAHIDMDWLWGYHETVNIIIDTYRTMLDLMKEYPQFKYSQSQAATYEIVEKYAPDMLEEIAERVREGRWEFAGSTWVETDKNLPNGESLARHILYAKRYMNKIFGLESKDMNFDFHPDTFGHSISIPEVFNKGGIKYFYHCRGVDGRFIYRWRSQSGATVLAYNEPLWYNDNIRPEYLSLVPEFCNMHGIKGMIKIYGVGDHGGGPTRKDIERILDMMTWPVAPTMVFSTYGEYFKYLEKFSENFPIYEEELNYTFTGCYTSQSRIKMANRVAEDRLYVAEAVTALSTIEAGGKDYNHQYGEAWKKVLFNQFHDIIPGSGIVETREHALGFFEEAMGAVGVGTTKALKAFAAAIDTSSIKTEDENLYSRSEGAGVGIKVNQQSRYKMPSTERGRGKTRIIHIFNPTAYDRHELSEVSIWDWNGDTRYMIIEDADGNRVKHQFVKKEKADWNHDRYDILIETDVKAFGYNTYILKEGSKDSFKFAEFPPDLRKTYYYKNILENDYIRAEFDDNTLMLVSLIDKETGEELVSKDRPSAYYCLAYENNVYKGGNAWVEGVHTKVMNLNKEYKVILTEQSLGKDKLRQGFKYHVCFKNSRIEVEVSLDKTAKTIRFNTMIDWHEMSKSDEGVPQLHFAVPFNYESDRYRYDIPFGVLDREPISIHDAPARNLVYGIPKENEVGLVLLTDTKYGYRGYDNLLQVSLLRASSGPDKYPEYGVGYVQIGIAASKCDNKSLMQLSSEFIHELPYTANICHKGTLPLSHSYMSTKGDIAVSAVKVSEDNPNAIIIRAYDISARGSEGGIVFNKEIKAAKAVDFNEYELDNSISINNNEINFKLASCEVLNIMVEFK